VGDWLDHPLILLVASALLSSVLIPVLTRRWQNHQKELELRTDLVAEITEVVTSLVMAVQFAEMGSRTQTQKELDDAYREWETRSAVIGSRLRAYFPSTELAVEWDAVTRLATNFYALAGMGDRREAFLRELLEEARSGSTKLGDHELAELKRLESLELPQFRRDWAELKAHLLRRRDAIVRGVLESRSAL
jgi:hypothetical protein